MSYFSVTKFLVFEKLLEQQQLALYAVNTINYLLILSFKENPLVATRPLRRKSLKMLYRPLLHLVCTEFYNQNKKDEEEGAFFVQQIRRWGKQGDDTLSKDLLRPTHFLSENDRLPGENYYLNHLTLNQSSFVTNKK